MLRQKPIDLHPMWDDLLILRGETLNRLIIIVCVAALGVMSPGLVNPNLVGWPMAIISAVLLATAGVARWTLARSYILALVVLSLGVEVSTGIAALTYARPTALFALPLFVFVASLFANRLGAIVLALSADALIWLVAHLLAVPLDVADLVLLFVFTTSSGALAWFFYHPIEIVLDWAWASYVREQAQTAVARARQAELAMASKSLSEACERLEEANATLTGARRAADEARRIKDEFATMVSHELRTPLNLVIGFSEMIARETASRPLDVSPHFRTAVEAIRHNALHLSDLADDVLDLGRLDAHRLALQKEWTNLETIAREAVVAVDGLYASAGLRLTLDVAADLPKLYVDSSRIRQVLINLLVNAVRYTDEGGVSVRAQRSDHDVLVTITDTGVGIAPEDLPFVFSGYRQTGQTHRRGGFGLGLTISKRFVEMHAGSMWVVSEPKAGATFCFTLPVIDNVAASVSTPSLRFVERAPGEASDRSVLILARSTEAARYFRRYLDSYRVVSATTPGDVQAVTKSGVFKALIVVGADLNSEDPLVLAAHRRLPTVPLLRCGLQTFQFVGQSLGASAFLTKPIGRGDLGDALRRLHLHPRRALVVDDSPEMTLLLRQMLTDILPHCQVLEAHNGDEALALTVKAARSEPAPRAELILLDLLMPGIDGRDLLAMWRNHPRWRKVPVIIVSAAVDDHDHRVIADFLELRRAGGMSVAEVMAAIEGTLDRWAAPQNSRSIAWADVQEVAPRQT